MIRATNGRMRGQNEARSPIVYSCSPRAVGSRPCPMVLSDHCRNCSVRLIPPYSTALFRLIRFAPKLRRRAQKPHGSSSVSARIDQSKFLQMTQIVAQRSVSRMGIDLNADSGKLAFPPTIDGLKNLALRFIRSCATRRGATYPLDRNRTPTAPATSGNSGSNGGASARLNDTLYKYSCCTKICV